jgi:hypothetical protein
VKFEVCHILKAGFSEIHQPNFVGSKLLSPIKNTFLKTLSNTHTLNSINKRALKKKQQKAKPSLSLSLSFPFQQISRARKTSREGGGHIPIGALFWCFVL